jgi:teichuronic acid biosynthesis glycosyltransferase TuaC
MLRVLTLSTLFPDTSQPTLGPFVERQTLGLAAHPDVDLKLFAPIGLPPWPLNRAAHYAARAALPEREAWKGLDVHRPRFLHLPGTGGRFDAGAMARALLPQLRTRRQNFAFDVIDAQFFFPDGPAAVALGKAIGVPVSIKARGSDIHYWGAQPATKGQILEAGLAADGLLAVSGALRADMIALGMQGQQVRVHYTGVDLDRFVPLDRSAEKTSLGISGPLIACVGTLTTRKGQNLLLEALPSLPDATLVLIGKGPDRAHFETQAVALGVSHRVRFTGAIPHSEIARWLGAADVMALPSASEGLANVWVEALACGTPIVITDVGGAREVVDRAEAGHLVAADPAAIAQAINDLIDHPRSQASVRLSAERFTWAANSEALYLHLKGLVAEHGIQR